MAGLLRAYACVVRDTVPVYPLSVHAGHSLFCIAFGGSSTADFLISTTSINLMSHPDVGWYWFLSYLAVYFSPFDLVYRMIQIPRSPTRIIFRSLECIDVLTTCT